MLLLTEVNESHANLVQQKIAMTFWDNTSISKIFFLNVPLLMPLGDYQSNPIGLHKLICQKRK